MNRNKHLHGSVLSALKGIHHGFAGRNFALGVTIAALVLTAAYLLPLTGTERLIIMMLIAGVLSAELFNSAIEELADALIQEHHPGIARVKELAAAGVLIFVIAAGALGINIFSPYVATLF